MKKVLIVEDDELMARMYKKTFVYGGYEVEVAQDGREGLTCVKQTHPSLVILDVMMPHMNGLELLHEIRSDPQYEDIKIILLTNLGVKEDIQSAYDKGISGFITKSNTEPSEVLRICKELLEG